MLHPILRPIWTAALITTLGAAQAAMAHVDGAQLSDTALTTTPIIVDCTLENGDAAQCLEVTVKHRPDDLDIGPFCPATLDDAGGIWQWDSENAGLYQLNRAFFEMLDAQGYTFFDPDGSVHIADIATAPPADDHACINVSEDTDVTMTSLIPIDPIMAENSTNLGEVSKVGLGVDGVPIFSDAPSVQQTGHLPALDTCGGHVDPGGWYHWHATATDIGTVYQSTGIDADCNLPQDASALFGYAFDGFALYGSIDMDGTVPDDLDACHGHIGSTAQSDDPVYHYHARDDFPNLPPCLSGVTAQGNFTTTAQAGVGATNAGDDSDQAAPPRGDGNAGTPPGFEQAAQAIGVTVATLTQAMNDAGGPDADLADVAAALGIDDADLRAALPAPPIR